jgi:chorismate mutase
MGDTEATACRGVRGAITVGDADPAEVGEATRELLAALAAANDLLPEEVGAAIFTVTEDLAGANPAAAARDDGWSEVPLLVVREHGGDVGVPRCIRVLLLWNTPRAQSEVRHVYLREARALRPDLQDARGAGWSL